MPLSQHLEFLAFTPSPQLLYTHDLHSAVSLHAFQQRSDWPLPM
jgi:hypothetical protein